MENSGHITDRSVLENAKEAFVKPKTEESEVLKANARSAGKSEWGAGGMKVDRGAREFAPSEMTLDDMISRVDELSKEYPEKKVDLDTLSPRNMSDEKLQHTILFESKINGNSKRYRDLMLEFMDRNKGNETEEEKDARLTYIAQSQYMEDLRIKHRGPKATASQKSKRKKRG
jgi:hypothetical protein